MVGNPGSGLSAEASHVLTDDALTSKLIIVASIVFSHVGVVPASLRMCHLPIFLVVPEEDGVGTFFVQR